MANDNGFLTTKNLFFLTPKYKRKVFLFLSLSLSLISVPFCSYSHRSHFASSKKGWEELGVEMKREFI